MLKKILPVIGIVLVGGLAGCANNTEPVLKPTIEESALAGPENTTPTDETSTDETSINETTIIECTIDESSMNETTETSTDETTEATNETTDIKEAEINNGDSDVINASVGDFIDLSEVIEGYSVSDIDIKSGDSVAITGRGSLMAEKKGTTIIECTLLDEETNTQTVGKYAVSVK